MRTISERNSRGKSSRSCDRACGRVSRPATPRRPWKGVNVYVLTDMVRAHYRLKNCWFLPVEEGIDTNVVFFRTRAAAERVVHAQRHRRRHLRVQQIRLFEQAFPQRAWTNQGMAS